MSLIDHIGPRATNQLKREREREREMPTTCSLALRALFGTLFSHVSSPIFTLYGSFIRTCRLLRDIQQVYIQTPLSATV